MDVAALETFREVARLGSLAAAARAASVDPSVVSRTIGALEAELGVRLFQRTTRRLALTEAGEAYLERVGPLIEELGAARDAATGMVENPRGLLRVTASNAFGQTILVPMLAGFQAAFPDIELELVLTDQFLDLVAERIDVAVRLGPRPGGGLVSGLLRSSEKRLVASPAYLRTHPPIRTPGDVEAHDCLRFSLDGFRTTWLFRNARGEAVRASVAGRIASGNAMALRDCAVAGLGLLLIGDWLVDPDIAAGRLVRVLADWTPAAVQFEAGIWVAYPSRSFLPSKARVFIDHLRQHMP